MMTETAGFVEASDTQALYQTQRRTKALHHPPKRRSNEFKIDIKKTLYRVDGIERGAYGPHEYSTDQSGWLL